MKKRDILHRVAFALLLACVVARPFLNEATYRTAAIPTAFSEMPPDPIKDAGPPTPERGELARVTFACGILLAAALWAMGGAIGGGIELRHRRLAVVLAAFAALTLVSALGASNQRTAMNGWLEQVSLLAAGLLAAQLCTDRRRVVIVVVVLAALAGTLATKGAFQRWVEIPQTIETFEKDRAVYLAKMGYVEGSPLANAYIARLKDTAVIGYIALANVFVATMMVCVMAAVGLAVSKLSAAWKLRAEFRKAAPKNEVHLPTVAAVLSALVAAAGVAVLVMTRSTGGIAAFLLALPACVLIWRFRAAMARRWKLWLAGFAVLILAGMAAVVAVGRTAGAAQLGHAQKTLLFRYLYWQASAESIAEHPLWGVGPANFSTAYLLHRDVRGEEAVKNPHNFAVQALTEYGLPGGACYLALLGGMIVCAFRPRRGMGILPMSPTTVPPVAPPEDRQKRNAPATAEGDTKTPVITLGAACLAVLFARSYFGGAGTSVPIWILDALAPAMVFGVMLAAAWWWCAKLVMRSADLAVLRIALGGGVAAFLLYEVISFNLTVPSAAGVFFLAVGAMMSCHTTGSLPVRVSPISSCDAKTRCLSPFSPFSRCVIAALPLAAFLAAVIVLWSPVCERTSLTEEMQQALFNRRWEQAAQLATRAAQADPLDPQAAADAAKAWGLNLRTRRDSLRQAFEWSKEATNRDGRNPSWRQLTAAILLKFGRATESLPYLQQAELLDRQDLRLHRDIARTLLAAGQPAEALRELNEVERIDRGLLPDSAMRLTDAERKEVAKLRKIAGGKP